MSYRKGKCTHIHSYVVYGCVVYLLFSRNASLMSNLRSNGFFLPPTFRFSFPYIRTSTTPFLCSLSRIVITFSMKMSENLS